MARWNAAIETSRRDAKAPGIRVRYMRHADQSDVERWYLRSWYFDPTQARVN